MRPLLVMCHGAGGATGFDLGLLRDREFLVLTPRSAGVTWDLLAGGPSADLAALERSLETFVAEHDVDPARIALAGFSDGASFALSVGLAAGDRFGHLLAFAPGFAAPEAYRGRPRVYITHGTADRVLPIDRTSRRIVPLLRERCDVTYEEFSGGHTVPPERLERALRWWLAQ